jgi:drug/metabolite transporter (DMT)-like permease
MTANHQAYIYAILAAVIFSSASFIFTEYSRKISPLWMSFFKTAVCFVLFSVCTLLFVEWSPINLAVTGALLVSGIIGLGIGDLFLLRAYALIGPGRTLILFGFQPLFVGISSWYFLGQSLSVYRFVAILFFAFCLFLFSLEKFKSDGRWEIVGLLAALLGVICDNTGILLTRWAFDSVTTMEPLQANFVRCGGALAFYLLFSPFLKAQFVFHYKKLRTLDKTKVIIASAGGTFVSLVLYLTAIRIGHLASVAAVGVVGPLFTTSVECVIDKKWPSRYLWAALVSFLIGFGILILL